MTCKVSKQDDSGVVEDKMKSIHIPYSTQSIINYCLILLAPFIKQKHKNQTTNILAKSLWIRHLLILLCTSTLAGNGC